MPPTSVDAASDESKKQKATPGALLRRKITCIPAPTPLLVFSNVTNKFRKHTDTAVAFTQEYSRVSYPLGNMSTLPTGSDSPRTHTLV